MKIKSFLYTALIMFLSISSFSSCEFEMSNNGDLDGFWQMTEMQNKDEYPIDMRNTSTTWGFNFKLVELRSNKHSNGILCRFEHNGNHLRIYDPREQRHLIDDNPMTDTEVLSLFGLYTTNEDFKIEVLNEDYMILVSEKTRLKFRKY